MLHGLSRAMTGPQLLTEVIMSDSEQSYLRDVQYRFPDRLKARSILHTRYGRGDWFEWLASNIPLPAGGVIADVGCGAGSFWTNAPQSLPSDLKLRLSDISEGMADAARASIAALRRWHDVEVSVADAVALPLANASVDTTIAIHMLYHLTDPASGLREMARVTREGGAVAVVLNPAGTMAELSALARAPFGGEIDPRPEPLSSEQGLALMQREFASVDVVRYDDELRVTDPVDLLGYLGSLPIADKPGVMEKLAAIVEDAFRRTDGVFTIAKASELLIGRR
ncbi:class I SAM-dependent methyltransferase [uncultured Sphingomonas sp.]|uniref:class I SAM-dependent methyltransferase n=1 Tax=uncultured Sphingomonas sp. TaxID=158754 RepID=UPI0025DDEC79|nr:class I SAM-dependent methyltransferase [uncultured Sphingomonas sp.]